MAKYVVEVTAHLYYELEVDADSEEMAIDYAMDEADDEVRWDSIDWDVDYVGLVEEDEVPTNQEGLF